MSENIASLKGKVIEDRSYDYDDLLTRLYAVSIGIGEDWLNPYDLSFFNPQDEKVFPTFAVLPPFKTLFEILLTDKSFKLDPLKILHGSQRLEIIEPLSSKDKIINKAVVTNVYDKRKFAILEVEAKSYGSDQRLKMINTFSIIAVGYGGFGGERGPAIETPKVSEELAPIETRTRFNSALLYQLNGDRNPLHFDPAFAKAAGFDKPILHGLCTWGISAFKIMKEIYGGKKNLKIFEGQFSAPVTPGDSLRIESGKVSENSLVFKTINHSSGKVSIKNGYLEVF